jgi:hypothetical protein
VKTLINLIEAAEFGNSTRICGVLPLPPLGEHEHEHGRPWDYGWGSRRLGVGAVASLQ